MSSFIKLNRMHHPFQSLYNHSFSSALFSKNEPFGKICVILKLIFHGPLQNCLSSPYIKFYCHQLQLHYRVMWLYSIKESAANHCGCIYKPFGIKWCLIPVCSTVQTVNYCWTPPSWKLGPRWVKICIRLDLRRPLHSKFLLPPVGSWVWEVGKTELGFCCRNL